MKTGYNRDMAKSRTSFKQGKTGNPSGRPKKGESLSDAIRAKLDEKHNNKQTYLDSIVSKLFKMALSGNIKAMSLIFERAEGKALNINEIINAQERPVTHADIMREIEIVQNEPCIRND